MPGPSKHQPPASDEDGKTLEAVLQAARRALARGDGWVCEDSHYNRLRCDCEHLGIGGSSYDINLALRDAINEIRVRDMKRKADESYGGLESGQTLYVCVWDSRRFKRRMYFKFAMNELDVEVFTFHEDSPQGLK